MRAIIHIDMDAFYASVEQRDNPPYRNRPVIVGADPQAGKGRGVVSAASYEARGFGIHSGMPISLAYQACPDAVFLPVRMDRYAEVSERIFEIFHRYTNLVEPLGLDEAFLDVTGSHRLFGPAETIGRRIQENILKEEGLNASVGVATNKFVAKVASDIKKPNGFIVVSAGEECLFLKGLPVERLWGSGSKTTKRLHRIGCALIGDVARQNRESLRGGFGKLGTRLWYLANGVDNRPVVPNGSAKTISASTTFPQDTDDSRVVTQTLLALADRIAQRLRAEGVRTKTLTLKHRNEAFETVTRSMSFQESTDQTAVLYEGALKLVTRVSSKRPKVRLVGLAASNLIPSEGTGQMSLFENSSNRWNQLSTTIDDIRRRFGDQVIRPGSLIESVRKNEWMVKKQEGLDSRKNS